MTTRIGPKMLAAVAYVRANGGYNVRNRDVCDAVSPHPIPSKNNALGYGIVKRAIDAGLLIHTYDTKARTGRLSLPEKYQARVEQRLADQAAVVAFPVPFMPSNGLGGASDAYESVGRLGMYWSAR